MKELYTQEILKNKQNHYEHITKRERDIISEHLSAGKRISYTGNRCYILNNVTIHHNCRIGLGDIPNCISEYDTIICSGCCLNGFVQLRKGCELGSGTYLRIVFCRDDECDGIEDYEYILRRLHYLLKDEKIILVNNLQKLQK